MMKKLIFLIWCCWLLPLSLLSQVVFFINAGSRAHHGNQQELSIDSKGSCRYYLREVNGKAKDSLSFNFSSTQMDSLFRKTEQVGFFNLETKYQDSSADGAGIYISVNSAGRLKSVHVVNTDVPAINELIGFLNNLLVPHRIRIYYGQK
jgi:hypothetical protein